MDWASLVLAGVAGTLGAATAHFLVRSPQKRRMTYILVFVFSFTIFGALSRAFVLPRIHLWQYQENIEEQLQGIPAYHAIRTSDPQTYERITAILREGIRGSVPPEVIAGRIRAVIGELVIKYIPRASDDAVVDFAAVMVREIEELAQASPDLCYQFLFPQRYGPPDLMKHIGTKTLQEDLAALARVIRTAHDNPQPGPDPVQSQAVVEAAHKKVYEKYGDDLLLLNDPHGPSVDRKKVCTIIVAVYNQLLTLPKKESGMALRYMFSAQR